MPPAKFRSALTRLSTGKATSTQSGVARHSTIVSDVNLKVSDVNLKGAKNGWELARQVREINPAFLVSTLRELQPMIGARRACPIAPLGKAFCTRTTGHSCFLAPQQLWYDNVADLAHLGTHIRASHWVGMEQFLFRFLPTTPRYPIWVRYLITLASVALTYAIHLTFYAELKAYPLLLFVPAIFLVSVIFDRGSGFLATFASAAVAATYIPKPFSESTIPLLIFVATGLTIAAVTETLRQAIERLAEAKAYAETLLEELRHRTKNELSTVISILQMQARTASNTETQKALASAVSRVQVVAQVHDRLHDARSDQRVQLAPYIEGLCQSLADFHRGIRPIAIRVTCDDISLKSSHVGLVGLIVNELATNAFKYAFPDDRTGLVEVAVQANDQHITITVTDDGVGCPSDASDGLGTRLIRMLTAQMKGEMTRVSLPKGCQVQVVAALDT
jgi:two-component sensor histidine kinase